MSECDHKNTYCLCAVEDIKNRALAQARAELEGSESRGRRLADERDELQDALREAEAKLAAAEIELAAANGHLDMERDHLKIAESQAAELRRALEKIHDMTEAGSSGGAWDVAHEVLTSLPASVQARAEREALVQAIVKASEKEKRWNCWAPKNLEEKRQAEADWKELTDALARLAALDSAQKGERR